MSARLLNTADGPRIGIHRKLTKLSKDIRHSAVKLLSEGEGYAAEKEGQGDSPSRWKVWRPTEGAVERYNKGLSRAGGPSASGHGGDDNSKHTLAKAPSAWT